MRHFLIDTDTGSDDAVALVIALRQPDIEVVGITTVAGNVPLAQATQNALYTIEQCACDKPVPVYEGCAKPILRELITAQNVHGMDGMGDIGLPLRDRQPAAGHAVNKLIELIHQYANDITLVTLGPLTNVALAVSLDPSIAGMVSRCVIMGGTSDNVGNMGLVGEYNIWADPEAAQVVFQSGLPITMVGWDISRKFAVIAPEDAAALRALDTPLAHFCLDINGVVNTFALNETQLAGFDLPDPIAMAVAIDPSVATQVYRRHAFVDLGHGHTRGQILIDHHGQLSRAPNADLVTEASREKFIQMLHTAVC